MLRKIHLDAGSSLEDIPNRMVVQPVAILSVGTISSLLREPFLLIRVNDILASPDICLFWLGLFRAFDVFPADDHDEVEWDTKVAGLRSRLACFHFQI